MRTDRPTLVEVTREAAVAIPLRDGARLTAELCRPVGPGRFPAVVSAAARPRGRADATGRPERFAERGYVHIVAGLRPAAEDGEGEPAGFDDRSRRDLVDLIEWTAGQPWCDGNVGMMGSGAFASAQLAAAVEQPQHLRALFAISPVPDMYPAYYHHGLLRTDALVSTRLIVEHQARDAFWDALSLLSELTAVDLPIYLAAHGDDGAGALPGVIAAWDALVANPDARLAILPPSDGPHSELELDLALQDEALAWFDRWLTDRGVEASDPRRVRFWLPGARKWRSAPGWPPNRTALELALGADGALAPAESPGSRDLLCLAPSLAAVDAPPTDPPDHLVWLGPVLDTDLDVAGGIELRLWATSTASDTAWMALLQVVAADGTATDVTGGWLRASLREVNRDLSRPGAPVLDCRAPVAVPIGKRVEYRIPLAPAAWRFRAGERLRLMITSDDSRPWSQVVLGERHVPVGTSARNTIHSTSRLLLPLLPGDAAGSHTTV